MNEGQLEEGQAGETNIGEEPAPDTVTHHLAAPASLSVSERYEAFLAELSEPLSLREMEQIAIRVALRRHCGSVGLTAKELGIGRATLYRRLAESDVTIASA